MSRALRLLLACAATVLVPGTATASAATLLVRFDEGATRAEKAAALAAVGGVQQHELAPLGVAVVSLAGATGPALAELNDDPAVDYAERDGVVRATLSSNDPFASGSSWPLANPRFPEAWDLSTGGPIVVAVLDTGVEPLHPEFEGRLLPGYDFANGDDVPDDDNGHGTAVAGIIAAEADNGIGVSGACWSCLVMPVKVLGSSGAGTWNSVAAGIVWATDQGAQVINLSLGGYGAPQTVADAVAYASERGVVLVASAGNSDTTSPAYPAAFPGVISVGAVGEDDVRYSVSNGDYWGSNNGPWVDIAAPGCLSTTWRRTSSRPTGSYLHNFCGTSAAAPLVSGLAALVFSLHPTFSAAEVQAALESAAGPSTDFAHGRIDAAASLSVADVDVILPDVSVKVAAGRSVVRRGRRVVLAVTVRAADRTAKGPVVRLTLPRGLELVRKRAGQAEKCVGRRTLVCPLSPIATGRWARISVVAEGRRRGRGWVRASVKMVGESHTDDNRAGRRIRVL